MACGDRLVSAARRRSAVVGSLQTSTSRAVRAQTPDERQQRPRAWLGPPRHGSFPSRIEVRGSYAALRSPQVQQRVAPQRLIAARTPRSLHPECLKAKIQ